MSEYQGRVVAIETFRGAGSVFVLAVKPGAADRVELTSFSAVIQGALIRAFITGAEVKVITEGHTPIIRRVEAFEAGDGINSPVSGDYRVNRLATQRTEQGDHLEAFLIKGNGPNDTAFNIFDPTLQPIFFAVFEKKMPVSIPIDIEYENQTVIAVRVGERRS